MTRGACIDCGCLWVLGTFTHTKRSTHTLPWVLPVPTMVASVTSNTDMCWAESGPSSQPSAVNFSLQLLLCWLFFFAGCFGDTCYRSHRAKTAVNLRVLFYFWLFCLLIDEHGSQEWLWTRKIWLYFLCIKFLHFLLAWVSKASLPSQESTILSSY